MSKRHRATDPAEYKIRQTTRFEPKQLAYIDGEAAKEGLTRSDFIRLLVAERMNEE